jgi:hypothetical protein
VLRNLQLQSIQSTAFAGDALPQNEGLTKDFLSISIFISYSCSYDSTMVVGYRQSAPHSVGTPKPGYRLSTVMEKTAVLKQSNAYGRKLRVAKLAFQVRVALGDDTVKEIA